MLELTEALAEFSRNIESDRKTNQMFSVCTLTFFDVSFYFAVVYSRLFMTYILMDLLYHTDERMDFGFFYMWSDRDLCQSLLIPSVI